MHETLETLIQGQGSLYIICVLPVTENWHRLRRAYFGIWTFW